MNFQRYDPSGSRGTEIQCFQYFSVLFCNLMIVLVFQSVLGEMTVFQCFTCLISFPMFQYCFRRQVALSDSQTEQVVFQYCSGTVFDRLESITSTSLPSDSQTEQK